MSGVEALARALIAYSGPPDLDLPVHPSSVGVFQDRITAVAGALLGHLSPADRLAIAGITEDRLAAALHAQHPDQQSYSNARCRDHDAEDAADLIARLGDPA